MSVSKYSSQQATQFVNENRQLHFPSRQATIQRVHSLRKVQQENPNFTPDIHDLPF
jgi:hypothetical protein